jgi:lipopolysaccharide heptosyltransferase II
MADPRPSRRRYDVALWIDRFIGPSLCAILLVVRRLFGRQRAMPQPEEVRRILLLKMWGMGSIVLASPMLARLRERHPAARIDFVSLAENQAIVGLYPHVDRVIGIDLSRGVLPFLVDTLRTIGSLRRERYDLLVDLEFFTRFSAIFSFLVAPRWSHGFSAKGRWRGKLHDVEAPFNAYVHVAQNFLTLSSGEYMNPVHAESLAAEGALPRLEPPEGAWERCERRLAEAPAWREGDPIVVVNPNAGDLALERRWPVEHVAEFLEHLTARQRVNVVLIGSAGEREHVSSVARASGAEARLVNLAGKSDLGELVALLAHAAVMVTNDSGPMHIAAAAGTSTVALFGPETPTLYRPLRSAPGQCHRVHYLELGCSPCMFVHDNKVLSCWFSQAKCMSGIGPAEVIASVEAILAGSDEVEGSPQLRVIDS